MMRRLLAFVTTFFAGALTIEVLEYHQIASLQSNRWEEAPQLAGALFLFAGFLMLAWPRRTSIGLFASTSALYVLVGVLGLIFHLTGHSLSTANAGTTSTWLGDPPALAPMEFAVAGMVGILTAAWEGGGAITAAGQPFFGTACFWVSALAGAAAFVLTAMTMLDPAAIAVAVALVVGMIGYAFSWR